MPVAPMYAVSRKNLNDCYTELIQMCRFLAMQIALETVSQIEQALEIHYSKGCQARIKVRSH